MNGTVSLWCGGPDSFRCSASVWPVQAPARPAGVAAGCGDAEWRRDGAWPGNLLLASHSSYADRHTTWRTRIVGRRARIQRTVGFNIQKGRESTLRRGRDVRANAGFFWECRLRLDLADKLTAKCCWLCVPDRASLLLLSPRSPHPAHTLGSWGVETGAGVEKRGREGVDTFLLGFSPPLHHHHHHHPAPFLGFPLGATRVEVSFLVFVAHRPESHLFRRRCSSMFPLAVTLCHPQTSTLSPPHPHFHPHGL